VAAGPRVRYLHALTIIYTICKPVGYAVVHSASWGLPGDLEMILTSRRSCYNHTRRRN